MWNQPQEKKQVPLRSPPDFLWRVVALMKSMRLSLRRAAHVVVGNPGTLQSG